MQAANATGKIRLVIEHLMQIVESFGHIPGIRMLRRGMFFEVIDNRPPTETASGTFLFSPGKNRHQQVRCRPP
jgi:hypothetical protein